MDALKEALQRIGVSAQFARAIAAAVDNETAAAIARAVREEDKDPLYAPGEDADDDDGPGEETAGGPGPDSLMVGPHLQRPARQHQLGRGGRPEDPGLSASMAKLA